MHVIERTLKPKDLNISQPGIINVAKAFRKRFLEQRCSITSCCDILIAHIVVTLEKQVQRVSWLTEIKIISFNILRNSSHPNMFRIIIIVYNIRSSTFRNDIPLSYEIYGTFWIVIWYSGYIFFFFQFHSTLIF